MNEVPEFEVIPGSRRIGEIGRRVGSRMPRQVWPFVVVAGLQWFVWLTAAGLHLTGLELILAANYPCWALLPAAVIVGYPTAWQSARGILVGVIAWSTVGLASRCTNP